MNWRENGRKRLYSNLKQYPGICVDGLRKSTEKLNYNSRDPGRDPNFRIPDYETGVLNLLATKFGEVGSTMCEKNADFFMLN
jgi:hypothetical protein